MAPIKVGIIGYGFSAKCFHLPFILPNPDLQVYAFLQRAPAPTDASHVSGWGHCTLDFPQAKHYRTADDFFADAEIELVVVCSHAHEEFVERSLNTGKHGRVYGQSETSIGGHAYLPVLQSSLRSPSRPRVLPQTDLSDWPRPKGESSLSSTVQAAQSLS
jgi:hypothetical protein